MRALVAANVVFVCAILVHGADHFRQGVGRLTPEVLFGGSVLALIGISTLAFTSRRDPRAPLAAAGVGLFTALAVSASHLAPHWSAFSDPYPGHGLDALSWAAALAEIVAALVFGLVGLRELVRARGASSNTTAPTAARSASL